MADAPARFRIIGITKDGSEELIESWRLLDRADWRAEKLREERNWYTSITVVDSEAAPTIRPAAAKAATAPKPAPAPKEDSSMSATNGSAATIAPSRHDFYQAVLRALRDLGPTASKGDVAAKLGEHALINNHTYYKARRELGFPVKTQSPPTAPRRPKPAAPTPSPTPATPRPAAAAPTPPAPVSASGVEQALDGIDLLIRAVNRLGGIAKARSVLRQLESLTLSSPVSPPTSPAEGA